MPKGRKPWGGITGELPPGHESPCRLGPGPRSGHRGSDQDTKTAGGRAGTWGDRRRRALPGGCAGADCHRHEEEGAPAHPRAPPSAPRRWGWGRRPASISRVHGGRALVPRGTGSLGCWSLCPPRSPQSRLNTPESLSYRLYSQAHARVFLRRAWGAPKCTLSPTPSPEAVRPIPATAERGK